MSLSPYKYLNDDIIGEIKGIGSENLVQVLLASNLSKQEVDDVTSQIFTELLMVYEENRISIDDIIHFLSLAIRNETIPIIFCQVFDVFPLSENLQKLLIVLYQRQNIIKHSTIAIYISSESLSKLGVVPPEVLNRQLNTRKRDEFYTQNKYNLLHEEVDGYSKFIIELYDIFSSENAEFQLTYANQVIEELIGHYSLDPNRCLDLLLEIINNNFVSNHEFAIKLLRNSQWWPSEDGDCYTSIEKLSYGGSDTAAKLIGLRLLKYPKDKDLPETFKIMIACLIKEGFLSFGKIYKYLRPTEEEMESLNEAYKKDLEDKVFKSSASALALAAPLRDDEDEEASSKEKGRPMNNSKKEAEEASIEERLRHNFKYQLLRVFLGNGLYWPSIYILAEYPFLAFIDPEIHVLICRLFDSMISPLYNKIRPFDKEDLETLQVSKKIAYSRPSNNVSYEDSPCINLLSFKPTMKGYSNKRFIYFYSEWSLKLPIIENISDLFKYSKEILKFVGVNLSHDLELFDKLCDIGSNDLKSFPEDESKKNDWFLYFRNFLFPAMPLIENNSFSIDKAYQVLSYFSIEERYNLYGELHQVLAKNSPLIKIAYGKAEKATKDVLKRLSKENVRPMMRKLAKISFSNPLPCLLTILQQIESYDNLNSLVVETARYFNQYGWDVLTLAIMMRLTASGRSNIQEDGLNERKWIQSLASFIGKICQRYPNAIDLHTLFLFLLKSFHSKESIGLIVLKEILISMGGIQTIANLTFNQIDMINSGSSLEKIVYRTIEDYRFERSKSGRVLVKTLLDLGIVNEMFVILCQLSDSLVFNSDDSHLKVLANKNDDLNTVIHLYTSLVNFFADKEELSNVLIKIPELCTNYNIPVHWAYEIWRPVLSKKLSFSSSSEALREEFLSKDFIYLPEGSSSSLTSSLYVTFWRLSLYDINYSENLYNQEMEKLESNIQSLKDTLSISRKDKDVSKLTIEKYRNDLRNNEKFLKDIPTDMKDHSLYNTNVRILLSELASTWFSNNNEEEKIAQDESFLQYCILPRAINSPFDASFSSKFLFMLHDLKTPNFSIILIIDILIKRKILFGTLFTLTSTEAENFGLFFVGILKQLREWSDKSNFDNNGDGLKLYNQDGNEISFEQYRKILYEYHGIILEDISVALQVEEYMCRRNAITFMKNLLGIYPTSEDHCEMIVKLIEDISKSETREDLKLSSSALIGHVKSRAKEWIPLWDFIEMSDEERELHMKKREEIKEKARKLELEAKEKEQKRKKEIEDQAKIAKSLKYDDNTTKTSRADIRGNSRVAKDRYDYYSKYGESAEPKPLPKGPLNNNLAKKLELLSKEIEDSKDHQIVEEKPLETTKEIKNEIKSNTKEDSQPPSDAEVKKESKVSLKERLQEAKNELKKKTQEPSNHKNSNSTREANVEPPKPASSIKRSGPLPPQHLSLKKEPSPDTRFNDTNKRFNNYGSGRFNNHRSHPASVSSRPHSRSSQRPLSNDSSDSRAHQRSFGQPPPPPPPPPPPAPAQGRQSRGGDNGSGSRPPQRFDNKRKSDSYGGRGYEKRQRY